MNIKFYKPFLSNLVQSAVLIATITATPKPLPSRKIQTSKHRFLSVFFQSETTPVSTASITEHHTTIIINHYGWLAGWTGTCGFCFSTPFLAVGNFAALLPEGLLLLGARRIGREQ